MLEISNITLHYHGLRSTI